MSPVGRWLARTPLSPNVVTMLGVGIQAVVGWLIVDGRLLAAGLVAIVGGLADGLDGALARAKGQSGRFGALLDSTTDRLSDAFLFVPVVWLYGVSPDVPEHSSEVVAALALVALVASFLVSYVKARAEALGYDCNVGIAERAERIIIVIVALLFDLLPWGVGLLAVLGTVTFLQRMYHVRAQAKELVAP